MKILYVSDALAIWGGLERILVEKINLLAEMYGYNMYVITANQGQHPLPFSFNNNVDYRDLKIQFHKQYFFKGLKRMKLKNRLNRLFVRRLREQIDEIQPDVIVSARSELMAAIIKSNENIPLVFESHVSRFGLRYSGANILVSLKSAYINRHVRHADMVVALTDGDARDWYSLNPRVCVIPDVVHLNDSGQYSDCNNKSVIFVGRFSYQKDIGSLVRIWEIVYQHHPDWCLHIYGGHGENQEQIKAQIARTRINIITHEPTPDIFQKYLESSILLMTSRYEPFGLVLPEAMSYGVPVVAFDCPFGPASIITNGKDGFLVKNRDINEFAEKVCLLIENPEMRKAMGRAGIQSSQRYNASLIMPKWKALFEQMSSK